MHYRSSSDFRVLNEEGSPNPNPNATDAGSDLRSARQAERNRPANIGSRQSVHASTNIQFLRKFLQGRYRMRTLPRTYKGASTRRSGGAAWQQQGRFANPTIFPSFSFHYFFFLLLLLLSFSFLLMLSHISHETPQDVRRHRRIQTEHANSRASA